MKSLFFLPAFCLLLFISSIVEVSAALINIYVPPEGDVVTTFYRSYSLNITKTSVDSNPNSVGSHYGYGGGYDQLTSLTFDIESLTSMDDVLNVSLNYNVIDTWTYNGSDVIGTLSGNGATGSVLRSNRFGWQAIDITDSFKLLQLSPTVTYLFQSVSQSGFTFGSAEGNSPAFLSIQTDSDSVVPEPASQISIFMGILGILLLKKKIK